MTSDRQACWSDVVRRTESGMASRSFARVSKNRCMRAEAARPYSVTVWPRRSRYQAISDPQRPQPITVICIGFPSDMERPRERAPGIRGVPTRHAVRFVRLLQRIKFVLLLRSASGASMPALRPASMQPSSQAIFLPRFRMICRPSASCIASSALLPCTMFQ